MRISEEIDALEVMGVPSLPFLVTTRVIAGVIAIIPLYVDRPARVFAAARLNVTLLNGQSGGHLRPLLRPVPAASDVLLSFVKVLVFAIVIIADPLLLRLPRRAAGPPGVGIAVGRAVRAVDRRRSA